MASISELCLLLYGESFVDSRIGKKKGKVELMNFHLEVGFKIAGEQDTKQGNTGIMIFKTIVHRIRKRHFCLVKVGKVW